MNEQFQLFENARKRIKQKKRLYLHFVIFLVGSVFLIVLNKILKVEEQYRMVMKLVGRVSRSISEYYLQNLW